MHGNNDPLKSAILDVALLRGTFTLHSGAVSNFYIDKYRFQTRPQLLRRVAERLAALLPPETERLAGVELGAVPLVTAVALATNLPFVIVRKDAKEYGTTNLIEGEPLGGAAVTLIEDIVTTGKASLAAAEKVERAGGRLLAIVAVIDRGEGAARLQAAGRRFIPLYTLSPEEIATLSG
jgi:orotate phosphoribosyltransferase